ncbi:Cyclic di-GMP phosphodiesterase response regulator RpfG [Marinomonas gallaica]|uniref:Cyclic di-GMP phosphodiesterase response regulator RpfG n=1 Tax=Marinomonas gallaica TaxID=1806667 RepID=A0A1C3JQA6_9GAMM|nr:HD domain-containing phosphohydrolase [Marinomonas gallaica]SBT17384.1 Cyclic di-GMP phosphodiesterase response regulator RpfG [Marinomonas gallaica]SBT19576.1 Cyclic di-GMP phosphodiesterase response regulator RpfG [Marinomonas gallaica]
MEQFACKDFSALDKELKDDLLECYLEAQQEIEAIVNDIESSGFTHEKLDTLFRSLHSMKGNCSVCFLDPLVGALHRLEEIVDGMRGGYIPYDSVLGELINQVLDQVLLLLKQLHQYHGADTKLLNFMQSNLDKIYAEEEPSTRVALAERFLAQMGDDATAAQEKAKEEADSLVVKVEYDDAQQADIDHFRLLSQRLNKLLGYSPERGERILKLSQLINQECTAPVDKAQLSAAAYMHNMGMAMILKCGEDEAAKQRAEHNHPMVGAQLLSKHEGWDQASDMVISYQERFDGSGYPEGLVGGMIPQGAFVLSMAVRFIDVVWGKSGDEYKKSAMRAIQKVNSESAKGIPPHLVDAFNRAVRKLLVAKQR